MFFSAAAAVLMSPCAVAAVAAAAAAAAVAVVGRCVLSKCFDLLLLLKSPFVYNIFLL